MPYETYVGHSRSSLADPPSHGDKNETVQLAQKAVEETNSGITQETTVKIVKLDGNATVELTATKDVENDLEQSGELKKPGELIVKSLLEEEEDVCPTCLEGMVHDILLLGGFDIGAWTWILTPLLCSFLCRI